MLFSTIDIESLLRFVSEGRAEEFLYELNKLFRQTSLTRGEILVRMTDNFDRGIYHYMALHPSIAQQGMASACMSCFDDKRERDLSYHFINGPDKAGNTPLLLAAQHVSDSEVIEDMVKQGASTQARNYFGETVLHKAALGNNTTLIEVLVRSGAAIDVQTRGGETALQVADRIGYSYCADELRRFSKDIDAK